VLVVVLLLMIEGRSSAMEAMTQEFIINSPTLTASKWVSEHVSMCEKT
jgi:hypothetical protein